jgi:hypothetical protein
VTFPHSQDEEKCNFIHDNISVLYGVQPMKVDQLLKTCTCGRALTYAPEVSFVNLVKTETLNQEKK